MTYEQTLAAYRALLETNPGKALLITEGNVAYLNDGQLLGAPVKCDGTADLSNSYEFDICAWDDVHGCWDCEEVGLQTADALNSPHFIDLLAAPV